MIAGREELGLGEKATYCMSQFLFDRERVPGASVILAILVVWGWVDAVEIVAGRSDRGGSREHGVKRGFPNGLQVLGLLPPGAAAAAQRRYCPLHHLHMQGVEETPTPEDSSLSVASLIAELDILQYRDAFASAGIDDERLRAIYKSGVDAVEEMIVATQLRGGSATKVRRRLVPKQVSGQSSASHDAPPMSSQECRKQHRTANKACEDPAEGETAHGAIDDDSSARAPGKPKVVARELTTLNGQMTVMTRADLEAALAHVRAAGDARNGVVVVEFSAQWCGGCRKFAAPYEKLIKELSTTSFCAVDVDQSPELVASFSVSELPLFVLFRESEVFDNLVGGKLTLLRQKIAAAAAGGRTKGGGLHMGEASGGAHRRKVESEVTMDCNKLQWILVYFKLICLIVTTLNGVSQPRVKQKIQECQES